MRKYFKAIGLLFAAAFLILCLSGTVFAASYIVTDVYYENAGGDIVRIDYSKAVEDTAPYPTPDYTLYNATVAKIREALENFRDVWVIVLIQGDTDPVMIHYSEALKNGLTLKQAVDDPDQAYFLEDEEWPEYTMELVVDGGVAVEKPSGDLYWLKDLYIVPDEIGKQWLIYAILDADNLPGNYSLNDVDAVMIKGEAASQDPDLPERWQLRIEKDPDQFWETVTVNTGEVVLVIGGQEYYLGS
ncbi:MAG: hypothetical protein SCJ97_05055 [Bacillota bacterium]|nr:hypothetical protein [Bacillota bacterium]